MKKIGKNGVFFDESTYLVFPLFKTIRLEEEFKDVYKEIFTNIDYKEVEKEIEKRKDDEQDI